MEHDKIMAGKNLEDIMARLTGCLALLRLLRGASDPGKIPGDAINGVRDLLEMIIRDFQADIDAADDYIGEEAERA